MILSSLQILIIIHQGFFCTNFGLLKYHIEISLPQITKCCGEHLHFEALLPALTLVQACCGPLEFSSHHICLPHSQIYRAIQINKASLADAQRVTYGPGGVLPPAPESVVTKAYTPCNTRSQSDEHPKPVCVFSMLDDDKC